jgi:hypothetical protein
MSLQPELAKTSKSARPAVPWKLDVSPITYSTLHCAKEPFGNVDTILVSLARIPITAPVLSDWQSAGAAEDCIYGEAPLNEQFCGCDVEHACLNEGMRHNQLSAFASDAREWGSLDLRDSHAMERKPTKD